MQCKMLGLVKSYKRILGVTIALSEPLCLCRFNFIRWGWVFAVYQQPSGGIKTHYENFKIELQRTFCERDFNIYN